ncbi:LpqB family beta-propeller domain-containing protein [Halostreptopolyspora alba]|uniref:Lipoprotein LpqB n=1 Tax=Halostreptopolyspora alba TaxID=2487137 RepID=A0A3N0E109_9ACTN|nr:hypothetical protein EFW17_22090 [Nocardiopsaceae bacterium YIM 96095]
MTEARAWRPGAAVVAAALATVVAGCASVPTSGPVVLGSGSEDHGEGASGYVRMLPAGPQPDVGEESLIKGFLRDMGSFEANHHAARLYLMPGLRETWAPEGDVLVYEDMDSLTFDVDVAANGENAEIRMRGPHIASIRDDGQYLPQESDTTIDVSFELAKDDGEWRIAELPDSLILDGRDVERAYRSLNLYFFNRDESTLVPDPVFLPVNSENMATHLVRRLVSGPTRWLDPAVRSAFPEGTRADAAYDSGVVTVELSGTISVDSDHYGMAAQLAWTLKQLPEVQELVLRIHGEEVELPGGDAENLQGDGEQWDDVDPGGMPDDPNAYFVRDGQLWSLSGDGQENEPQESRVEGALGEGGNPLRQHAVSLDESRIAGLEDGLDSVVVAEPDSGGGYESVLSGGEYTSLSWDPHDDLWVVERTAGSSDDSESDSDGDEDDADSEDESEESPGSTIWVLRDGETPVEAQAPELADVEVSTLRISRDGSRAAVITESDDGPRLYVGRVTRSGEEVSVGRFVPLGQNLSMVSDVTWRGGDQLAVIGQQEREAVQAFTVSLDGVTETTSAGAPTGVDMQALAAAPGRPLLSSAEDDQVWLTNDRFTWRFVAEGTNPVYPG